ncbi:hypothetical protein [Halobacteriovorax sp. JY17]|uniref:hypothetical protein n=1 Tax=Halobacteriovorax sp. JY17 TaxID=2014617 RepID=UPI000C69BD3E|nr:hypothetical protein [Halobacteriovorax sp. JY17]PIK13758.1 MAG: hypothetical protein CES88_16335 [Halobacteriovorax sp. JY17]
MIGKSLLFISFIILNSVSLASVSDQGEISFENRKFESDNDNLTYDDNFAIFTRAQFKFIEGNFTGALRAYARADSKDKDRNHYVIEDAYGSYLFGEEGSFKLLAGWKLFNWSAMEAFHPADVVNSKNFDGEIEKLEKKGELTLESEFVIGEGTLNFYFWPRVENPIYPSTRSRTGVNFGIEFKDPVWVNGRDAATNSKWQPQWGIRFNQTIGDLDFALQFLDHFDRAHPLVGYTFGTSVGGVEFPTNSTDFRPHFYRVRELGGTLSYAFEGYIFKLEGSYRKFEDDFKTLVPITRTTFERAKQQDHGELAFGVEDTISLDELNHEVTLIFEVTSVLGANKIARRRLSAFQRDALIGMRYNFNDLMGSELFLSYIQDLEYTDERLLNLSFTRRLSDQWKYKLGLRTYQAKEKGFYGLQVYKGDGQGYLNISRFF